MSRRGRSARGRGPRAHASVFAALGDKTRLLLVAKLSAGRPHSISQLTEGSRVTRQAITKHLRVLQRAGLVSAERAGRERRFELRLQAVDEARKYLDQVSEQWDQALGRLRAFVERP